MIRRITGRFIRRARREDGQRNTDLNAKLAQELQSLLDQYESPSLNVSRGRLPNDEEIITAVWGNLAAEDPTITLEEIREGFMNRPALASR